jgi:hypothetical protein
MPPLAITYWEVSGKDFCYNEAVGYVSAQHMESHSYASHFASATSDLPILFHPLNSPPEIRLLQGEVLQHAACSGRTIKCLLTFGHSSTSAKGPALAPSGRHLC